jgi:drug/metabolite transporter (DMT)-like permease
MTPEIEAMELAAPAPQEKTRLTDFWAVLLVVLTGVSYGSQAIIGKWVYANGGNAITLLTIRSVVAMIVVWLIIAFLRPPLRLPVRKVIELSLLGVVFVSSSVTYYVSLMYIQVGTAILIAYIFPALVVVGAVIFYREKFTRRKAIALLLAIGGCILTVDPVRTLSGGVDLNGFGLMMALISAFVTAGYILLSARLGKGVPGVVASAYSLPAMASFYVIWCALGQVGLDMSVVGGGFAFSMNGVGWLCCIIIGLLTSLAWTFYLIGLPKVGPSRASILVTSEPATAVFLGIIILGEAASPVKLVGGAFIFWAVFLLRK